MQTGRYRVSLVEAGKLLAPPVDIHVNIDHLTELLAETIVEYKAKTRFAKSRAAGDLRWMVYSGVYEHPWQANHDIEVTIEEPREAFKRAWSVYDGAGRRSGDPEQLRSAARRCRDDDGGVDIARSHHRGSCSRSRADGSEVSRAVLHEVSE